MILNQLLGDRERERERERAREREAKSALSCVMEKNYIAVLINYTHVKDDDTFPSSHSFCFLSENNLWAFIKICLLLTQSHSAAAINLSQSREMKSESM
jgi:hypothetical protein